MVKEDEGEPKQGVPEGLEYSGLKPNEQSVFEIIFVKLANFRANISETNGDFFRLLLGAQVV